MNKRLMEFLLKKTNNDKDLIITKNLLNNFIKLRNVKIENIDEVDEGFIFNFYGTNNDYLMLLKLNDIIDFHSGELNIEPLSLTNFSYRLDLTEKERLVWDKEFELICSAVIEVKETNRMFYNILKNMNLWDNKLFLKNLLNYAIYIDFDFYYKIKNRIYELEERERKNYDDIYIQNIYMQLKVDEFMNINQAKKISKEIIDFHITNKSLLNYLFNYEKMLIFNKSEILSELLVDKTMKKYLSNIMISNIMGMIDAGFLKRNLLKKVEKKLEKIPVSAIKTLEYFFLNLTLDDYIERIIRKASKTITLEESLKLSNKKLAEIKIDAFDKKEKDKLIDICDDLYSLG